MNFLVRTLEGAGSAALPLLEWWSRSGADPDRAARLGHCVVEPQGALWMHHSSVGEFGGALPLLRSWSEAHPGTPVRLTCQTRTGLSLGRAQGYTSELAPFDLGPAVRRRLETTGPRALLVVETELWPVLLRECVARIPVAWAGARISQRRFSGLARLRESLAPSLARVCAVAAQTSGDARRFVALGVPAGRVSVTGNPKHDRPIPAGLSRTQAGLAESGPVVVLGSIREGEEAAAAHAVRRLRGQAVLVVAPRHPREGAVIGRLLEQAAVPFSRRSEGGTCAEVLLLDTMGELGDYYRLAQVAFVGGSLRPLGGHDVLEPARAGAPVLFGPHTEACAAECEALLARGGAVRVRDAADLPEQILRWLGCEPQRAEAAARAREVAEGMRGSVDRTLGWLQECGFPAGVRT